MKNLFLYLILAVIISSCNNENFENITINSPDNNIKVNFELIDNKPHYSIQFKNTTLISRSEMGMILKDSVLLNKDLKIEDIAKAQFKESWHPVWWQSNEILNHYNELIINMTSTGKENIKFSIIFRVFNDGVGFRYVIPEEGKEIEIISEETYFNFENNFDSWSIPGDFDSYEHLYVSQTLKNIKDANTPVTFQTKEGYCFSIHEAALTDYAGMTLKQDEKNKLRFKTNLVPWPDGIKVKTTSPMKSPWRTFIIAENPAGLIESTIVLNLNEPCKIENTSWIQPMKYCGIWWGMHIGTETWTLGERHGATTKNTKRHIDFASSYSIKGVLIEGWNEGWENWGATDAFDFTTPYEDFDLEEIVRYAASKNIEIIGHHETGGDVVSYEKHLDEAFKLYSELGIHAVKTGYAGRIRPEGHYHHGQYMVNHYRKVVETAVKYQIMIDAHEPIKATGICRTYPNMMTREGVRGMEWNAWSEGNPPEHTVIIPFTRCLGGPVDYTPGIFDILYEKYKDERVKWNGNDKGNSRVHTTLVKQLALFVVLYSPLQMAADLPENYEHEPAFDFISRVPVTWDETKVINAEIGQYVTIARRKGESWYIGCITNEEPRTFDIPFDFLEADISYEATVFADDITTDMECNPVPYKIDSYDVNNETVLNMVLVGGGGQAVIIEPVN